MRTRDVISKAKKWRDFYGFDIAGITEVKTKADVKRKLSEHRELTERALSDALAYQDAFERELGLDFLNG